MASSKAKTTMNKLNRERKVRERRLNKEARKTARVNSPEAEEAMHVDHLAYWLEGTEGEPAATTATES
ncbi:MAG TPA: hypothetical protein VFN48_03205 [Solirubrobacteraceae bacterium]|nr:hypothetical protein [Solirubrobacteraceae bacterium]